MRGRRSRRLGAIGLLVAALPAAIAGSSVVSGRSLVLADPPTLQDKCEWQAQHSFLEIEYQVDSDDEFRERNAKVSMAYHPHYNAAIGRCLMLVEMSETSPAAVSHTSYIVDAGKPEREYAFYREIGGVPIVCQLRPSWGVIKFCTSRANFDDVVARYMDQ